MPNVPLTYTSVCERMSNGSHSHVVVIRYSVTAVFGQLCKSKNKAKHYYLFNVANLLPKICFWSFIVHFMYYKYISFSIFFFYSS